MAQCITVLHVLYMYMYDIRYTCTESHILLNTHICICPISNVHVLAQFSFIAKSNKYHKRYSYKPFVNLRSLFAFSPHEPFAPIYEIESIIHLCNIIIIDHESIMIGVRATQIVHRTTHNLCA